MAQTEKQKESLKKARAVRASNKAKLVADAKANAENAEAKRQESAAKVLKEKALTPGPDHDGYVPDGSEVINETVDDEGVVRPLKKKTPMNLMQADDVSNPERKMPRKEGNWIPATHKEMCKYSDNGTLVGWDPYNKEVLLKEEEDERE